MSIFTRPQPISNNVLSFEKKMLLKKIEDLTDLPIPNVFLVSVIRLMRDENVDLKLLVDSLQKDQALVAKILKIINSGYYSLKKEVDSVEKAVGLLGLVKVKQIVYSASVMDIFSDEEKLEWDHAYSSSILMDQIVRDNELSVSSTLPMAMLMHDIGKVVLRRFSPQKYKMAQAMAKSERLPVFKAEEKVLQINHAEAGSVLMAKWEMDEDIIIPVMHHHFDGIPSSHALETALIQIVNWVDCAAREIKCPPPSKELLAAVGFESLDKAAYVDFQRQNILKLDAADPRK